MPLPHLDLHMGGDRRHIHIGQGICNEAIRQQESDIKDELR